MPCSIATEIIECEHCQRYCNRGCGMYRVLIKRKCDTTQLINSSDFAYNAIKFWDVSIQNGSPDHYFRRYSYFSVACIRIRICIHKIDAKWNVRLGEANEWIKNYTTFKMRTEYDTWTTIIINNIEIERTFRLHLYAEDNFNTCFHISVTASSFYFHTIKKVESKTANNAIKKNEVLLYDTTLRGFSSRNSL